MIHPTGYSCRARCTESTSCSRKSRALGPSKAEDLAISILGGGQYVDIDPSLSERSRVGATRARPTVYRMLKYGQQYVDKGMEHYDQRYRDQQIQSLKKKAAKLDLRLLPALPLDEVSVE